MPDFLTELIEEFRLVFSGRNRWLDAVLPPLAFLAANTLLDLPVAAISAGLVGVGLAAVRLARRQPLGSALAGLGGVILATGLVWALGRAEGFFLPNLVSSAGTVVLTLISLVIRRPLVAWTSHLARRWPRQWYWHPQVRPAYTEVTWLWLIYFSMRLLVQLNLFQATRVNELGLASLALGWPATLILLVVTYVYGTWRLGRLEGPGVEEFKRDDPPPWEGQRRGF